LSRWLSELPEPQDIHISQSAADNRPAKLRSIGPLFDRQAMYAVSQYDFEPGTFQGKAVPVELKIEVNRRIY
jgi:hypothetical protein